MEDKKPDLRFKEGLLDENPSYHFSKAIEHAKNNEWEDALKHAKLIKENIGFLAERSTEKRKTLSLLMKIIKRMDCKLCFFDVVRHLSNDVQLSIAIAKEMDEKIKGWIKEMLGKGKERSYALEVIKDLPKSLQKEFIEEVIKIGRSEVEKPQYIALDILKNFVEEDRVKRMFMSLVDDWDKEVRIRSIEALMLIKEDEGVRRALERAYESERDKSIQRMIKLILEGGKR